MTTIKLGRYLIEGELSANQQNFLDRHPEEHAVMNSNKKLIKILYIDETRLTEHDRLLIDILFTPG